MGICGSNEIVINPINQLLPSQEEDIAHPQNNLIIPQNNDSIKQLPNRPPINPIIAPEMIQSPQQNTLPLMHKNTSMEESKLFISSKTINYVRQLQNKFCIYQQIDRLLSNTAYTSQNGILFAKLLIEIIKNIEYNDENEKKIINEILNDDENIKLIKNDKLFYHGIQEKIKQKINKNISLNISSRIYHMIANIKKDKKINIEKQNQFKINILKNNSYKFITQQQLQQVVKYQVIGSVIMNMGQILNFQYLSLKHESQSIFKLLQNLICKQQNKNIIINLKYDLNDQQIKKISKISRQACQFIQNGVFILLVYLIKTINKLQTDYKLSPSEIQSKLQKVINIISKDYPPGSGLKNEQQYLMKALKQLQDIKNYKKSDFKHNIEKLTKQNKQHQVQKIIIKYSKIAQKNKSILQQLVKTTCLQKCAYFKIGLKYNPDNPNRKSMIRIKQKIFFNKKMINNNNLIGNNIQDILQKQQRQYLNKIDKILDQMDNIQFKISDMIRGKCVFLKIQDIIETVNEIKRFIKLDNRYELSQIQSRFTNQIPISDVTLKIILNRQIIGQLQLTIQTNAATYSFAHKIYQLQRSKVFSKIKIINNYYQQSRNDFNQLIYKAINIATIQSPIKFQNNQQIIKNYFNINSNNQQQFKSIIQKIIQKNKQQIPILFHTVQTQLQDLMLPLLNLQLGKWNKQIGTMINTTLDKPHSHKLKASLLSFFFKKIDLSLESQRMQQYVLSNLQKKRNKYMQGYLLQYFGIKNPFQYLLQTHRIYHRGQQLLQIQFSKQYQSYPISLQNNSYIQGLVMQNSCIQKANSLKQFLKFYFVTRTQDGKFYSYFECYYNWLFEMIFNDNNLDKSGLIMSEAKMLKGTQLLQKQNGKDAQILLKESKKIFKQNQRYRQVLICDLLLFQCYVNQNSNRNLDNLIMEYNNVKQQAKILGIQIKGKQIARSLWRITKILWNKFDNKKKILQSIATQAFIQLSRSTGKDYVYAMLELWSEYNKYNIKQPQIKQNDMIHYQKLSNLYNTGCQYLSKVKWTKLNTLNLWNNGIKVLGLEHLSKSNWKNLSILNLRNNRAGDLGCQHLSKADWKQLTVLNLRNNKIGDVGCENLIKANWKKLMNIDLQQNGISAKGCDFISRANWKELKWLNLSIIDYEIENNKIGDIGCDYLCRGNWRWLYELNLCNDQIIELVDVIQEIMDIRVLVKDNGRIY